MSASQFVESKLKNISIMNKFYYNFKVMYNYHTHVRNLMIFSFKIKDLKVFPDERIPRLDNS